MANTSTDMKTLRKNQEEFYKLNTLHQKLRMSLMGLLGISAQLRKEAKSLRKWQANTQTAKAKPKQRELAKKETALNVQEMWNHF